MKLQHTQQTNTLHALRRFAQRSIPVATFALTTAAFADGLTWQPVSIFTTRPLIEHDGSLVTLPANASLAVFDTTLETWAFEGPPVPLIGVQDLIAHDGTFFASGSGGENIWQRTESAWTSVGGGLNDFAIALAAFEGDLIVGGGFTEAGGGPANYIARWDGTMWSALGEGFDDGVLAVTAHDGLLVAGGWFTEADGQPANRVAAWDGASWQPLGEGLDGDVWALLNHEGQLYAGGAFPSGVAEWNGATWQPVGGGLDAIILALALYQGDLVAGGTGSLVARLQDGVWQDISKTLNGTVIRLQEHDGDLFASPQPGGHLRYGSGSFIWPEGSSSGEFSGTNWLGPAGQSMDFPPGDHDRAIFNFATAPTLNFTQDQTTDRLILRRGNVTFDLNGYHYEQLNPSVVTPGFMMGFTSSDSSTLNVTNGTMHSTYGSVGESPGSLGSLHLDGPTTTMNIDQALWAAWQGVGLIEVSDGATLDVGDLTVAAAIGSFGEVMISDENSSILAEWSAYVGDGGFGFFDVLDGAEVIAGDMTVANKEGSIGETLISGAGSTLHVQNDLRIPWRGEGAVRVEQGATLQVDEAILLDFGGSQSGEAHGSLFIRGEGSAATVGGSVAYGPSGSAELRIAEGGRLIVGDSIEVYPFGSSRFITFEVSSADHYVVEPAIAVANDAELPIINVQFIDGYEGAAGDFFLLVTAASLTEPNALNLPDLPNGLTWHVIQQPTQFALEVIEVLPGDLNSDGVVNVDDLLVLLNSWGDCADCDDCIADITGDCAVGVDDLLEVLNNWTG